MNQDNPILVDANSAPTMIAAAVRVILAPVIGSAIGAGYIQQDQEQMIIAAAAAVALALWQLYVAKRKHTKMRVMANETPNDVAQVK